MSIFPIPYQSPETVVFGPFAPENVADFYAVTQTTWNSSTTTRITGYLYGVPFTQQSPVLAQKIWCAEATPGGGTVFPASPAYGYCFGIYDENGVLIAKTYTYGQQYLSGVYGPYPGGTDIPYTGALLTTPTVLNPGNYYMAFLGDVYPNVGNNPFYGTAATTPLQTSRMVGVKEAIVTSTWTGGAVTDTIPNQVTWTVPTQTQCPFILMQGIGVSI